VRQKGYVAFMVDEELHTEFWYRNQKLRYVFEDLSILGMILKCILQEQDGKMWAGLTFMHHESYI
jgi:hypothetical protein